MMRPVIGITPGYDESGTMLFVKDGYYKGLMEAGGLPLILPLTGDKSTLEEYFEICDGFLLCGGPDMDARHFGEENMSYNGEICPIRDEMEMFIARRAIELKIPIFGICRGIQVMNVAMGGSLYQDIVTQIKDRDVIKHFQSAPYWYPTHEIHIERGSRIWNIYKKEKVGANSFHHQSVKNVAPGFIATSRASDDVIESIEYGNHPFAVGVQWHPEIMWEKDDSHLEIFRAFVRHASERRLTK